MSEMPAFSQRDAGKGAIINADEDLSTSAHSRSFDEKDDKNFSSEKGDATAHVLTEEQAKDVVVVNDGT